MEVLAAPKEVLPGIWQWQGVSEKRRALESKEETAFGEAIFTEDKLGPYPPFNCFYIPSIATLIDPTVPPGGMSWFGSVGKPERVLLTTPDHDRLTERFVETFGCEVLTHEWTVDELAQRVASKHVLPDLSVSRTPLDPKGFAFGDTVAPGVVACEVGEVRPSDTAFHIALGKGSLVLGDGLINFEGRVGVVDAKYIKNVAPLVTAEYILTTGVRTLSRLHDEFDFDALLFSHGELILRGGKEVLAAFLQNPDVTGLP